MKTVCIVPIKSISKRVKSKNFRIIGTKPLYRLLLDKLKDANFDKIYIDSDSEEIESYAKNHIPGRSDKRFCHTKETGCQLSNYGKK